jgi:hypothetical protein
VGNPDWVLRPDVSLFILVHGMSRGTFTGNKLEAYVNATTTDYFNARRVVNAVDRADVIAGYAADWNARYHALENTST